MKRFVIALFVLLCCLCFIGFGTLQASASYPLPPPHSAIPSITFISDSDALSQSAIQSISHQIRHRPITRSERNMTIRDSISMIQGDEPIPADTTIVVIDVGIADFHQDRISDGDFAGQYDYLTESARVNRTVKLVCVGLWSDPNQLNAWGMSAFHYSELMKAYGTRDAGCRYVDLFALHFNPANSLPDGRPSPRGEAAIARAIVAAINR